MQAVISRVILYVRDVDGLKQFYQIHLGLEVTEEIAGEWAVLKAGAMELALHRVGKAFREHPADEHGQSNSKIVFSLASGLMAARERMISVGVTMRPIKRYDGFPYSMCDGLDPEGNVFQLMQLD
ncbi:VOC family protein [Dyella sp. A6]|uniref:VOC family protein n=1 Tax=Dyella aluminiiresistens TaxID=3069105 RepID=UPI002E7A9D1C|nr:VOC family protein [Dyella sp. A6]